MIGGGGGGGLLPRPLIFVGGLMSYIFRKGGELLSLTLLLWVFLSDDFSPYPT